MILFRSIPRYSNHKFQFRYVDEQALQWYSGDSCAIPSSSDFYGESGTDSLRVPQCPKCPLICSTTEPASSVGF